MAARGKPLPLTDLVYGILGLTFLSHDNTHQILRDSVYSGLRFLAEKHPMWFPTMHFTDRGGLQHSKEIEDALYRLGAGVLEVKNPRYQYISFSDRQLTQVKKNLSAWLDNDARKAIDVLAAEFHEHIKENDGSNAGATT